MYNLTFPEWFPPPRRLPVLVSPRQHVHEGELQESREDEDQTGHHPHVDGLGERHGRQVPVHSDALSDHRQDGEDPEGDPGRDSVEIDPEWHPGKDDNQQAWEVDVEDVALQATLQVKMRFNAWVRPCSSAN